MVEEMLLIFMSILYVHRFVIFSMKWGGKAKQGRPLDQRNDVSLLSVREEVCVAFTRENVDHVTRINELNWAKYSTSKDLLEKYDLPRLVKRLLIV